MSVGSGLAAQIGIADETVVGTAVPVTSFTKFLSESLQLRPNFVEGKGLPADPAGAVVSASRRTLSTYDAGGDITFNLPGKGFGRWLKHSLGSSPGTPTQIGTTGVYTQIHNLGSSDGASFTLQKGVPSTDGTVNPLTYRGCKVTGWEFSAKPNDNAEFKVTVDAMDEQPTGAGALALQAASYSTGATLFGFAACGVNVATAMTVVGGVWTPTSPTSPGIVRSFNLKGGWPKDTARWNAGSYTKAEALSNDYQPITGQLDVDFASMDLYTQFKTNTPMVLQFHIAGPTVIGSSGTNVATVDFTMPAAFLDQGSSPQVGGPGVVTVSYQIKALSDDTHGALQVVTLSTDSAV